MASRWNVTLFVDQRLAQWWLTRLASAQCLFRCFVLFYFILCLMSLSNWNNFFMKIESSSYFHKHSFIHVHCVELNGFRLSYVRPAPTVVISKVLLEYPDLGCRQAAAKSRAKNYCQLTASLNENHANPTHPSPPSNPYPDWYATIT